MERAAPGGRKKTEKQDGNFRFPDVNVMAYYCRCHSVFVSEPLGRFSSMGALMLQQGLIQALKQPMISGLKTTKGFLSPSCLFLHVFFLPHYSCSLRSVPQLMLLSCCPVSTPDPMGNFTCSMLVRSQAQSGKLAACLPGFCLFWVSARVAVISTKPNSGPLPSFSFNEVSWSPQSLHLHPTKSFLPSFFLLFAQIYFLRALFMLCFLPWSSTDGTMVYINIIWACAFSYV